MIIRILVFAAGFAALSWEVLWQIKASLALGISAWGTAITLAITMGGMGLGSYLMGRMLKNRNLKYPGRLYGLLECLIGCAGLVMPMLFNALQAGDALVFAHAPAQAPLLYMTGIAAILALPTLCMGATLPVLGKMADDYRLSIATLYGMNTLGAATGVLGVAFILIPQLGVQQTGWLIAGMNLLVGSMAALLSTPTQPTILSAAPDSPLTIPPPQPLAFSAILVVCVTGAATFALEIAWFRSLTAFMQSTSQAFALMLAAVLLALGLSARLVPWLRRHYTSLKLWHILTGAGFCIFVATPLVERFGVIVDVHYTAAPPGFILINLFISIACVLGTPMLLLGMAFPWLIADQQQSPRQLGLLYALNTFAAMAGTLVAAWIFLPAIGFACTAWLAGGSVMLAGLWLTPAPRRAVVLIAVVLAATVAIGFETGAGRRYIQGNLFYSPARSLAKILDVFEGPEATVAAIQYDDGARALVINGFVAASQRGADDNHDHYMAWMGHLPMLLNVKPDKALVICFGTGQTAHAVRQENPKMLDIVDVNPRVIKMAHHFEKNHQVLDDPRVRVTIMDGRAYLHRTSTMYDVITLEPMPPSFAGVNALYSQEFYQLARSRLSPTGTIAQWVPFHLLETPYAASIVRTFQAVFPNSIVWSDPSSKTGILLGAVDPHQNLMKDWPGFARTPLQREHSETVVRDAVFLNPQATGRFAAHGSVITDDNQLLGYGHGAASFIQGTTQASYDLMTLSR
jgi:spermidine synthase